MLTAFREPSEDDFVHMRKARKEDRAPESVDESPEKIIKPELEEPKFKQMPLPRDLEPANEKPEFMKPAMTSPDDIEAMMKGPSDEKERTVRRRGEGKRGKPATGGEAEASKSAADKIRADFSLMLLFGLYLWKGL